MAKPRSPDAIYEVGYGSSSRLYEKSSAALGMTPRVMRAGGAGLLIRYTTAASPLGRMLVATTDVGICSIAFGKDDKELVAELRGRFSKAQLVPAKGNTGWLAEAVAFVVSQLGEHPLAATFPLDVRATAFQQRVWKALQAIPRGETRSYWQHRAGVGNADGCAGGGNGDWVKPRRGGGALSSRDSERWIVVGVSLGRGTEAKLLEAEKS